MFALRCALAATATALSLLVLSSCADTLGSDEVILAVVDATVAPNPVTPTPSENPDFQWLASFTVTLIEAAGTGATINSVLAIVNETSNGIAVITDEEVVFQLSVDAESNRVEANSTTEMRIDILYTLPGAGSEAVIDISISMTDDNGAEVGGSLQAEVN